MVQISLISKLQPWQSCSYYAPPVYLPDMRNTLSITIMVSDNPMNVMAACNLYERLEYGYLSCRLVLTYSSVTKNEMSGSVNYPIQAKCQRYQITSRKLWSKVIWEWALTKVRVSCNHHEGECQTLCIYSCANTLVWINKTYLLGQTNCETYSAV